MLAAAAVVVPAGLAWACVALVAFRVEGTGTVQPGGTVKVFGGEFARGKPVEIHLDSPTGPVLATVPNPMPSTMTSQFTIDVPIPDNITPGPHLLVATQDHFDMNVGIPARATFYVNGSAPAAPLPVERPTTLAVGEGTETITYVLIALGVAAAGLVLAAGASVIASRKSGPGAAGAQTS